MNGGRVFLQKMALVCDFSLPRPQPLGQPSSLIPDVTCSHPRPVARVAILGTSWHDRLQTISGLKKGGGEGEGGGGDQEVGVQCSGSPACLKEEDWERTLGSEGEKHLWIWH